MITVVIPETSEKNVIDLTYDNLSRESYPNGHRVIVADDWLDGFKKCKTEYICFVEPFGSKRYLTSR